MKSRFSDLWKEIRDEKGLLTLCFLLAFFSWQGIRKSIGYEMSVSNVAVEVDVPEGWAVWEKSLHRVNILFRGSREDIRYLNNEQLRVVLPVPSPDSDEEMVLKLSEKFLRNPTAAKVVQFSPSEIAIKLDQEDSRLVPVKAAIEGALSDGLEVNRIICNPASVRITGARKVLDEMDNIHTEPINLTDRQVTFKETVPVALPHTGRIRVEPDWISVECLLVEHSSEKTFSGIPLNMLYTPGEHRQIEVSPQTLNVVVKGQAKRIEEIKATDISAYIKCMDLIESTKYELPVVVDLPVGIKLIRAEPSVVNVRIINSN